MPLAIEKKKKKIAKENQKQKKIEKTIWL